MANVGGDRMNLGIKILRLPLTNGFFGGRLSGWRSGNSSLGWETNLEGMNQQIAQLLDVKTKTTTLSFSLKDFA